MALHLPTLRIGTKLPVIMVSLVVLTISVMSFASIYKTSELIGETSTKKLETVTVLKAKRVQALLDTIDRDLRLQAAAPTTNQALIALTDGYVSLENREDVLKRVYIDENPHPLGEKNALVSADTGSSYGFIHAIYHPSFENLRIEMDYYDVFLFDTEGNLVYSVFKENDFATNMITGPWSTSGLAEVFRIAVELGPDDPAAFVDFTPYEPSNMAPAAFIARPVFDAQGTLLGVLAFQMPIGQLNAAAGDLVGLGETTDGFIVGANRMMRTDSVQTPESDILKTVVENPALADGIAGNRGSFEGEGYLGADVIGYQVPVDFLGTRWVVVVQQDRSELFNGLKSILWNSALVAALVLAVVTMISVFFSRTISRPVQSLTDSVAKVAGGQLDTVIPSTDKRDEIGELARATEVFRQNAIEMEKLNEDQKAAHLKMTEMNEEREKASLREIDLAREREQTDKAVQAERKAMMEKLGASFGDVVTAALAGNFSQRVEADFEDLTLQDLSSNINALMGAIDAGLSETTDVLSSIAEGDLTKRMEGKFEGSFEKLQVNVNQMIDALTALVRNISESGTTLSGSSAELRQTADVLSRQAEQNAASVEETSAALEELSASIQQVNQNVAGVSGNAKEARIAAEASEKTAQDAATSMDRIAEGSKEISRVTGVINDIAFQINLLALNAGVEAARAGDAGRGFSVVASEVRQLAQRASEAAKEITSVINQSDTAVSEGVKNVSSAKASLENIATSVIRISESVEEVTRAMSEQSSGIREITTAVSQVDRNTQKQAAAFEEVTASSHVLAQQSEDLMRSTTRFRVKGQASIVAFPSETESKRPQPAPVHAAAVSGGRSYEGWDEF
jgi:methyl-accepting chemotaxis protein